MIYLGHKEAWPPSRVSDPEYVAAQQKINSAFRSMVESVDKHGVGVCSVSVVNDRLNWDIQPFSGIFNCGD